MNPYILYLIQKTKGDKNETQKIGKKINLEQKNHRQP